MRELAKQRLAESVAAKRKMLEDERFLHSFENLTNEVIACLRRGGKLILCGNGGSASDALHFAGEIVGRFQLERDAWPAVVLNADVASMTAISNDYGFQAVFSRQVQAFATNRDLLIGISTSGNSENVFQAVRTATEQGVKSGALLGGDGGKIGQVVNFPVIVPTTVTARVQECHICLIHILCELVENALSEGENAPALNGEEIR